MKKLAFLLFFAFSTPLYAGGYHTVPSLGYGVDQVGVGASKDITIVCGAGQTALTQSSPGVWACGSGGAVSSVSNVDGTLTISPTTGAVIASIPSSVALPGNPTTTTQTVNDNSTKIATTAYVNNAVLGQNYKEAAKYASIAALPAIVYANGSSGVGATLTGVALGAISLDSASPAVNDRVLIKNQVSTFQNGIYTVTATGSGIAVFVLTRATDANQAFEYKTGDAIFVTSGSTLFNTTWAYTGIDSPTMGTDAITYAQISNGNATPTGTGFTHINAGFQDAASRAVNLASNDVTGTLALTNAGLGLTSISNDAVLVGNNAGTGFDAPGIPDCQDTTGNHLNYTASTGNFGCGTTNGQPTFSRIKVDSGNGVGSGSTKIRRFSNLTVSQGGMVVRSTDSVSGDVFTIVGTGYCSASRLDYNTGAAISIGISLNADNRLASAFGSSLLTASQALAGNTSTGANNFASANWSGPVVSGDKFRAHEGGTVSNATDALSNFDISCSNRS